MHSDFEIIDFVVLLIHSGMNLGKFAFQQFWFEHSLYPFDHSRCSLVLQQDHFGNREEKLVRLQEETQRKPSPPNPKTSYQFSVFSFLFYFQYLQEYSLKVQTYTKGFITLRYRIIR